MDGIAVDNKGRFYVSEWGGEGVYRFDKEFKDEPVLISNGHNDPADIYIDKVNHMLVVPNFSSNSVDDIKLK